MSILPTFYEQLLCSKIPKAQRDTDDFQKVFHFDIASYLKFHVKCEVSNEVQSNKINRGESTAVSVSYLHITK